MPNKPHRRPKGEGSITLLPNGRYRVRIETDPIDGKRHWLTKVVSTKTEAQKTLKDLTRQKEDNHLIVSNRPNSFSKYITTYLDSRFAQGIQGSSYHTYTTTLTIVGKFLGDIPISLLTTEHFDAMVSSWRSKGLAERTVRTRINTTSNMLDWCVYKGIIPANLLSYHKKTQKKIGGVKDIHHDVLSSTEHEALKAAMLSVWETKKHHAPLLHNQFYPCYLLAYETGMRVGELAALKWEDLDLDKCVVSIKSSKKTDKHSAKEVSGDPKYNSSRSVVFSSETSEVLKVLKGYSRSEYVFTSYKNGYKSLHTNAFRQALDSYKESIGMTRDFTVHDIRHTNASIMIHAGVPLPIIAERLGHSSVEVTLKTYAHVLSDCEERQQALVKA